MRILLIEDHQLFRDGLMLLLSSLDESLEFLEADDFAQLAGVLGESRPEIDIVLLDLHLPDISGLEVLSRTRELLPAATIVVLSSEDDADVIRASIDEGAAGFIPKSSSKEVLIAALRLVLAGGCYIPPPALENLRPHAGKPVEIQKQDGPIGNLTARQQDVLNLAVQGKVNKIIARELDISEATVKNHLSACFRVLGVTNRTEAVFAAANAGLSNVPGA